MASEGAIGGRESVHRSSLAEYLVSYVAAEITAGGRVYIYMHIHTAVADKCVMAAEGYHWWQSECTLWPQSQPILNEPYMATEVGRVYIDHLHAAE